MRFLLVATPHIFQRTLALMWRLIRHNHVVGHLRVHRASVDTVSRGRQSGRDRRHRTCHAYRGVCICRRKLRRALRSLRMEGHVGSWTAGLIRGSRGKSFCRETERRERPDRAETKMSQVPNSTSEIEQRRPDDARDGCGGGREGRREEVVVGGGSRETAAGYRTSVPESNHMHSPRPTGKRAGGRTITILEVNTWSSDNRYCFFRWDQEPRRGAED